jgi:uncharacterized lipoprotein NlpE involved in copper resistance
MPGKRSKKQLTMIKQLAIAGSFFLLASCGTDQKESQTEAATDTVKTEVVTVAPTPPPVTTEHYAGTLPCADCAGIQTELTLKSDSTWAMHIIYDKRPAKGPGSNEFSEEGKWMMHGADTVHLMGRKEAPSMYLKTDSSLIQLDMKGKRIEGKLASKYVLKKM